MLKSVSSGAELDAAAVNELVGALACETTCEPAAQVPDDEVEKLTATTSGGGSGGSGAGVSVGVTVISVAPEPGKPEPSLIDNFSSMPLEELQDSFGVYKEKYKMTLNHSSKDSSFVSKIRRLG